jgi:hypothetical protein
MEINPSQYGSGTAAILQAGEWQSTPSRGVLLKAILDARNTEPAAEERSPGYRFQNVMQGGLG